MRVSLVSLLSLLTSYRDDFLWIDKWNGEVHVWYNEGVKTEADRDGLKGSIMQWTPKGKLYNGVDRGQNEYFMDYGTLIIHALKSNTS